MAPRPVYSVLIGEGICNPSSGQTFMVPDGFVWVVRDIAASHYGGDANVPLGGFQITDGFGATIWQPQQFTIYTDASIQWTGHQVIEPGDGIYCAGFDYSWVLRISGYALTTP